MLNNKQRGMRAENFFMSKMNEVGLPVVYRDDWYDFEVADGIKVEVKSCALSVKDSSQGKERLRPGRFDFEKEDTRELLNEHDAWVCFVVNHHGQFLLMGFVKARKLGKKRYVPVHKVREFKPLLLEDWMEKVQA